MHIVNLMQCTELGGMEWSALRLMQALRARGHRLTVLSLNPLGRLAPLLEDAGITAEGQVYRGPYGWHSARIACRALAKLAPDALIMTGHHLATMLALPATAPWRRLLAMHHVHRGVKPPWQWWLIYTAARWRFSTVSFPSDSLRAEALVLAPSLALVARTVHNPLPLPAPTTAAQRADARARLGLAADAEVIGNAGRLIPQKRFDVFLAVAARLAQTHPRACFVIAGDGPQRARLVARATALGVGARIYWLGWQTGLTDFYRALDLMLFNADDEAMPTTPLEAMAHGVPVVASVCAGGLSEVLRDGVDGVLLPGHDVARLAAAAATILDGDPAPLRAAARARVAAFADPARIAAEVEALLGG